MRFDLELKRVPFRPQAIGDSFDGRSAGVLEDRVLACVRAAGVLDRTTVRSFDHRSVREADWLSGAALLVRREAADAVGLFDEAFFLFGEEVDWMTRFRRAGWKVLFFPGAEVVHVGGASHGGRLFVENLRGQLRWFDKHQGAVAAERVRRLLLGSLRLRAATLRRPHEREGVRFLRSGDARTLIHK